MTQPNACNVLVIEDDPAIRQSLVEALTVHGYTVTKAADGQEAGDKLRAMQTLPCLILLDLMMPVMNGWRFLDIQRSDPRLKTIPVIICSAYTESAKSVQADGFLPKPVDLDDLLAAVRRFCTPNALT